MPVQDARGGHVTLNRAAMDFHVTLAVGRRRCPCLTGGSSIFVGSELAWSRDTNPQLVDLQDVIRGVLLRYDPAARQLEADALEGVYRPEAQEILKELRLETPRSFLEVLDVVGHALSPLDAVIPRRGLSEKDSIWMAAEEIWQAWAFYGLQD